MNSMPALFVSHGPPFLALSDEAVTTHWKDLGQSLPGPKAIVCISAHWETVTPMITACKLHETIHDFSGPSALFGIKYDAPGAPELSTRMFDLLNWASFSPKLDPDRGLDHGVWVPLRHMFPAADIPVVQLSIQPDLKPRHHYHLGKALQPLRDEGVLILGSGGAVHNLDEVHDYRKTDPPPAYVLAFNAWLQDCITGGDSASLIDFQRQAPAPERCHPWPAEHFLPLLVTLGAAMGGSPGKRCFQGFLYGVLSMASYVWGQGI